MKKLSPKTKKILKIAAQWEAANIGLWLLQGKPKALNGKPKSLSVLLNAFSSIQQSQSIAGVNSSPLIAPQSLEIEPYSFQLSGTKAKPVGLIMWDGFYTDYGNNNENVALQYDRFINVVQKNRVIFTKLKEAGIFKCPFYTKNIPPTPLTWYGGDNESQYKKNSDMVTVEFNYNQSVMDAQIDYARQGKIDYLAFCHYANESPLSIGRRLFASSTRRGNMKMCFFDPNLGYNQKQTAADIAAEMRKGYYMRIDGKPLLYINEGKDAEFNLIKAAFGGEIFRIATGADVYYYPTATGLNNALGGAKYNWVGYGFGNTHDYNSVIAQMQDGWAEFKRSFPNKLHIPTMSTGTLNYVYVNFANRQNYINQPTTSQLATAINIFKAELQNPNTPTGLVYAGNEWGENANGLFPTQNANGSLDTSVLNTFARLL